MAAAYRLSFSPIDNMFYVKEFQIPWFFYSNDRSDQWKTAIDRNKRNNPFVIPVKRTKLVLFRESMFKLNRKTEYGLLALQYMARLENNEVATVKEIASQHRIPQSLLAKILQGLARKKIIQSVKGARGGYVMDGKITQLTLADVVEAIEGPISITDCRSIDPNCERMDDCTLRERFEPLQQQLLQTFRSVKILDFVNKGDV